MQKIFSFALRLIMMIYSEIDSIVANIFAQSNYFVKTNLINQA